jgi:hypothetical protein
MRGGQRAALRQSKARRSGRRNPSRALGTVGAPRPEVSPDLFITNQLLVASALARRILGGARGARKAHPAHGSRLEVEERFRSGLRPDRAGGFTSKAPCTPCPAPAPPPRDPSGIARSSSSRPRRRGRRELAHPCARTCAPWTPPTPCRSSAAVTGLCHSTRHPWLVDFAIRQEACVAVFAASGVRGKCTLLADANPARA